MKKEFKLTKQMDLIKIYERGEFDEFVKSYDSYKKLEKEYLELMYYVRKKYFPETLNPIVDFANLDISPIDFFELPFEDQLKIQKESRDQGIKPISKESMFDDPKFQKFSNILIKLFSDFNIEKESKYILNNHDDFFKNKFVNKYCNGLMDAKCKYITLPKEAELYGNKQIIDFINEHPLEKHDLEDNVIIHFKHHLRDIRINSGLTLEEFADAVGSNPKYILSVEEGDFFPGLKCLINYANVANITLDELVDYEIIKDFYKDMDIIIDSEDETYGE